MTTCILCLGKLQKAKSVKLSEPVCDTFTLGDALRQQIRSNILQPYTQSSSKLTCKSCLNSFQTFFKFLQKVNTNLNNFKTENTFEITTDCHQVYVPPNVLMLKMEPLVLLLRIKSEPELTLNEVGLVKVDIVDTNVENFNESKNNFVIFEENNVQSSKDADKPIKDNDIDRFSDDSDFAWSYDDPMDSMDDNEPENNEWSVLQTKQKDQVKRTKTKNINLGENNEAEEATSLSRSSSGDQRGQTQEKTKSSSKKYTKISKNSNANSDNSRIKAESSDDELDTSGVKHEDSDKDLNNSENECPLLNRKSPKAVERSSKSTRNSTKLVESPKSSDLSKKSRRSANSPSRTRSRRSSKLPNSSNIAKNIETSIKAENLATIGSTVSDHPSEDSKTEINTSTTDPNGPLPLFPAKTNTGYIRYLPRDQITLEMINSGQLYVVIDGVEYRIPQKPGSGKPKKKKSAGFTREEDASRRSHPAHDPEGQEKIKNFIDIKCYVCGIEFESFFKLKKHFKRFHPDSLAYLTCCGRNYKRRCDLLDHIEQHDKSAVHICTICNKEYKTKGCLRIHMKFYHPKDDAEKVICYECGKICNNSSLLKMHLLTHNVNSEKSFECYICSKKLKNIHNVKRHLNMSHALTSDKIICHICSASVKETNLSSHMKHVHQSDRTRVNCERCGIWILKTTFKVHMMKHTDMGVNCKVCGKFLRSTYSLTAHMKTVHSDKFKFKCQFCDKGFHREVKMEEHVAVKHTREFPFKCRVLGCGREFRAEGNWKCHEKKAHPEEYNKYYKPYYKRDNEEIQELEELLGTSGGQL